MLRAEHPNPQKKHASFINLNGTWEFEYDNTLVGKDKRYFERESLDMKIEVPFCPESKLSGIGNTDFINAVWYRRDVLVDAKDLEGNVLITFGAVDYQTEVYINGRLATTHTGGYTPFTVTATKYLVAGKNSLCVYARDDKRWGIPRGKQCGQFHSVGCDYTRTTGIWQTVYMECLPKNYIKNVKLTPDVENCSVLCEVFTCGDGEVKAEVTYEGKTVGSLTKRSNCGKACLDIPLSELHLWEIGEGRLYDIKFAMGDDLLESYFGMRSVCLDGKKFLINGKSSFHRFVLDQGFYEDGIYTAPAKEDIEKDILLSKALGFNGARPHMKVFEPLYFYYCDKHGYPVWGEFANWGLDFDKPDTLGIVVPQWLEAVERDYSHPSIIGWCPLNETNISKHVLGKPVHDSTVYAIYALTKALDPIRPCIDTSGYVHQKYTDIYDMHNYTQDPERLKSDYAPMYKNENPVDERNMFFRRESFYNGQPLFISEFGGAKWSGEIVDDKQNSWGYGNAPKTEDEFMDRFKGLCHALMDNENIFGFCYTQLYDIEQEQNGLLYYDRTPKFEMSKFKEILDKTAAVEK